MNLLPHWVLTDKFPAFYDSESKTAIEQTARVYGAMQELITEYNKFVDSVNQHILDFENAAKKDYEIFTTAIRQEFQDFIDVVTLKIQSQDSIIEDAVSYMKTNLSESIDAALLEMRASGGFSQEVLKVYADMENQIAALNSRMNTFTTLEEGSTTGDAELQDGRTDYTGKTWDNIGSHIRGVTSELSSEIVEIENGLNEIIPEQTTFINSDALYFAKEFEVVADKTTWGCADIILTDLGLTIKDSLYISIDSTTYADENIAMFYFYANNEDETAVSSYAVTKNDVVGKWKKANVPSNINKVKVRLYASTTTPIPIGTVVNFDGVKITKNKDRIDYALSIGIDTMKYIYVSKSGSDVSGDGTKEKPFATIYKANESIVDNSKYNPYTIIVGHGTYTDLQEKYSGTYSGTYEGVICKDYVYYESENVNRPDLTVISWNGASGFEEGTTFTDAMFNDKCPFHIIGNVGGMHTHIKGFTFVCENTRYAMHVETEGKGIDVDWLIENCVFDWRGKTKLNTYHLEPAIGMGSSPFEKGRIANCNIFNPNLDNVSGKDYNGIQNHNNAFSSVYGFTPYMICGAEIEIENCNLNGLRIEFRTWSENYDTFNLLTLRNLTNVYIASFGFVGSATKQTWKGVVEACDIVANNIS